MLNAYVVHCFWVIMYEVEKDKLVRCFDREGQQIYMNGYPHSSFNILRCHWSSSLHQPIRVFSTSSPPCDLLPPLPSPPPPFSIITCFSHSTVVLFCLLLLPYCMLLTVASCLSPHTSATTCNCTLPSTLHISDVTHAGCPSACCHNAFADL